MATKKKASDKEKQISKPLELGNIQYFPLREGGSKVYFSIKDRKFIETCPANACSTKGVPSNLWIRQFMTLHISCL